MLSKIKIIKFKNDVARNQLKLAQNSYKILKYASRHRQFSAGYYCELLHRSYGGDWPRPFRQFFYISFCHKDCRDICCESHRGRAPDVANFQLSYLPSPSRIRRR